MSSITTARGKLVLNIVGILAILTFFLIGNLYVYRSEKSSYSRRRQQQIENEVNALEEKPIREEEANPELNGDEPEVLTRNITELDLETPIKSIRRMKKEYVNDIYYKFMEFFKTIRPTSDGVYTNDLRHQFTMSDIQNYIERDTPCQEPNDDIPPVCKGRIDVLWTYVNGTEEKWMKQYSDYLHKAVDPNRYIDMNTLKYSMRSVFVNAPFVQNYFILVDGPNQIPSFIDKSTIGKEINGKKLTILYHKDVFPAGSTLPTFNSNAIEASFFNIKNISECFIYLNDDMFISNRVRPSFFVSSDNKLKVYHSSWLTPFYDKFDDNWHLTVGNTNKLLNERFGYDIKRRNYVTHNCYFFKKSILERIEKDFPALGVSRTKRTRNDSDLALPFLHGSYAAEVNEAEDLYETPTDFKYYKVTGHLWKARADFNNMLRHKPMCSCVNDAIDYEGLANSRINLDKLQLLMNRRMNYIFPVATPFELNK